MMMITFASTPVDKGFITEATAHRFHFSMGIYLSMIHLIIALVGTKPLSKNKDPKPEGPGRCSECLEMRGYCGLHMYANEAWRARRLG